ncbi:hypothetical protein DFH06DRAFT_1344720 [Mycena polygramma]|nr:hypothetical protein DFH06DRAFT_1344720 [Mycena polygramma]
MDMVVRDASLSTHLTHDATRICSHSDLPHTDVSAAPGCLEARQPAPLNLSPAHAPRPHFAHDDCCAPLVFPAASHSRASGSSASASPAYAAGSVRRATLLPLPLSWDAGKRGAFVDAPPVDALPVCLTAASRPASPSAFFSPFRSCHVRTQSLRAACACITAILVLAPFGPAESEGWVAPLAVLFGRASTADQEDVGASMTPPLAVRRPARCAYPPGGSDVLFDPPRALTARGELKYGVRGATWSDERAKPDFMLRSLGAETQMPGRDIDFPLTSFRAPRGAEETTRGRRGEARASLGRCAAPWNEEGERWGDAPPVLLTEKGEGGCARSLPSSPGRDRVAHAAPHEDVPSDSEWAARVSLLGEKAAFEQG